MSLKLGYCKVLEELEEIEGLLEDPRYGLAEIKREIRDIEEALSDLLTDKGPLSTGPFYVRAGEANAINVLVQNVGKCPIDVKVRLFDLEACPPEEIDCESLECIERCTAEAAVLTAPEGIFEVVVCPKSDKASVRAFVSVHSGDAPNSSIEYTIKAEEMLPVVCPFCKKKCGCRRDPCCPPQVE